jgi:two-component system, OmpR family, sensor histidine kinase CiaH
MPDGAGASRWTSGAEEPRVSAAEHRLLRGVRINLALWSGGITLVVLVLVGVVLYLAVERSLAAQAIGQLEARAAQVTGGRPDPGNLGEVGVTFGGPGSGTFVLVADAAGQPVLRPRFGERVPEGLPLVSAIEAVATDGSRDVRSTAIVVDGEEVPVRVLTEDVRFRGQTVYLQVVGDRTTEERTIRVLLLVLVAGGVAALIVASGAGAAYASRALVPIRRSLVAQREALRRQREFAADASHELRTPLTVIRASVEDLERHRSEPVEVLPGVRSRTSSRVASSKASARPARAATGA